MMDSIGADQKADMEGSHCKEMGHYESYKACHRINPVWVKTMLPWSLFRLSLPSLSLFGGHKTLLLTGQGVTGVEEKGASCLLESLWAGGAVKNWQQVVAGQFGAHQPRPNPSQIRIHTKRPLKGNPSIRSSNM